MGRPKLTTHSQQLGIRSPRASRKAELRCRARSCSIFPRVPAPFETSLRCSLSDFFEIYLYMCLPTNRSDCHGPMSAKVQEIMSILTPPPSELDDCDMNRLLTCSPALSHFCYPSPTPSYRTFCADMQSTKDNNNLAGAGTTNSFFTQEELPYAVEDNGSQQMFFNTNTNSGFYQTSLNSSERAALYDATLDMPLDDSLSEYQAYDQSHWMTYSSYEGVQPMMAYSTDTINTPFPLLDTSHPPTATNLIPPTPQTTIQTPFNFDAAPNQYSSSHLSTTPSYPNCLPSTVCAAYHL